MPVGLSNIFGSYGGRQAGADDVAITHSFGGHQASGGTPTPSPSGFFANGSKLSKMSTAILGVNAKSRRAVWVMIGDSITAGWGAAATVGNGNGNAPGSAGYSRTNSTAKQLAPLLTSRGIPARADAIFGNGISANNTAAEYAAANPSVSFGAGWAIADIKTLGGDFFTCPPTSTTAMTFTPDFPADSFDFYVTGYPGLGTFTVTDSSGTLATISESSANGTAYIKVTVTRSSPSTNPISIQRNGTGNDIFIGGIVPYDTTAPRLELWNMGWAGSQTADWISQSDGSAWAPYNALQTLSPDLVSIELGANDANAGVAASTYQSNLQTLIGYAQKSSPDLWLIKTHQTFPATAGGYNIPAGYLTAIDTLSTNNLAPPALDFNGGLSGLVAADYYDNIHMSAQGYGKKASYASGRIGLTA